MRYLSEFEKIDISLALERPRPQIRFLVLEQYVSEVKEQIISLSSELKIDDFTSIETRPAEIRGNPDGWFDFLVTVDWMGVISVFGVVSSMITIGTFVHRIFKFLKKRRARKEARKLKMNCTTSITLAINHLRSIGARIRNNQIRLVYLSHILAYYCVAIFSSPITDPKELHVITTGINGKVSSYSLVAL